jgi:hypothetical protein
VAELADALDSKAGATLGSDQPIDALFTLTTTARPASQDSARIAAIAGLYAIQPDAVSDSCTLYGARALCD